MNFNPHYNLIGKHAFLSASKYHWLRYSEEKLVTTFLNAQAVQRGTELHELACKCIKLGVKLQRTKQTLNMFVNDAIGYGMTPEQPLYFSDNCFGTADAIGFKSRILRVHDLKTGVTDASMDQLHIYDSLFCLEYGVDPKSISIINRIYQNDDIDEDEADSDEIAFIMDKIMVFDKLIIKLKEEG